MLTPWLSIRPLTGWLTTLTLAATFAVATPPPARAAIVLVTGNGDILNPDVNFTSARANAFQDGPNAKVHGWDEKQGVRLTSDLFVDIVSSGTYDAIADLGGLDGNKIARGTVVSSHLLYYDPRSAQTVTNVTFEFDAKILGVIVESDRFYNSAKGFRDYFLESDFLGHPSTEYPTDHFNNRGLELGTDRVSVSISGRTITIVSFGASSPGDQIRVITEGSEVTASSTPAPAGVLLGLAGAGSFGGFAGLGWLRRRLGRS